MDSITYAHHDWGSKGTNVVFQFIFHVNHDDHLWHQCLVEGCVNPINALKDRAGFPGLGRVLGFIVVSQISTNSCP